MKSNMEIILRNNYKLFINKKLGNGAFGDIYKGENILKKKQVAIKCELMKTGHISILKNESILLYCLQGGIGIPKIYIFFSSHQYNFMIFELLGLNLEQLFYLCNKKFTNSIIKSLGLQMLSRLEFIHKRHIIHRDIKPENFLIGKDKNPIVYICDFGLGKRFRDKKTGMHIPYKNGKNFTGTLCFASIYTHMGIEQSRRDDLESLAYILIYFSKGSLPWKGLKTKNKSEKNSKILSQKMNTSNEDLCSGIPKELSTFLQYTRDLQFEERPDYDYLRGLLNKINNDSENINKTGFDNLTNIFNSKNINNSKTSLIN